MSGGRNAVSEFLFMVCFVFVFSSFGGQFNEGGGGEGGREEGPAAAAAVSIMVAIQAAFVRQSCYARLTVAQYPSLQFHFLTSFFQCLSSFQIFLDCGYNPKSMLHLLDCSRNPKLMMHLLDCVFQLGRVFFFFYPPAVLLQQNLQPFIRNSYSGHLQLNLILSVENFSKSYGEMILSVCTFCYVFW